MSDTTNQKKLYKNPLEALREISKEVAEDFKGEMNKFPSSFKEQIIGKKNYSGEIMPGESLEIKEVFTGKREETEKYSKLYHVEKTLRERDQIMVERRTNELRIQIEMIHEEIIKLAKVTPDLNREVELAAFQAPGAPSEYEKFFLDRIFEFIKSFREKIEDSRVWLAACNRRARKKNVWGANLKKHGAKYLLSGEHYASRSAA